jgi:hypothetical protein
VRQRGKCAYGLAQTRGDAQRLRELRSGAAAAADLRAVCAAGGGRPSRWALGAEALRHGGLRFIPGRRAASAEALEAELMQHIPSREPISRTTSCSRAHPTRRDRGCGGAQFTIVSTPGATAYWVSGLVTENWYVPALSLGTVTTSWVADTDWIAAICPPMLTCGVAPK